MNTSINTSVMPECKAGKPKCPSNLMHDVRRSARRLTGAHA